MDQPVTSKPVTHTFRNACITWFTEQRPTELWSDSLKYVAYGVETCPTTGRQHLQMWASIKNPQRLSFWKKLFPGAHIEQMHGTLEQSDKYCSKESRLVTLGERPMANGKRKDLDQFCQRVKNNERLKDIALDMPTVYVQYCNGLTRLAGYASQPYEHETVRGYWIYGVPGAGKTHYVKTRFEDIYIKAQNKWFDGYNGEKTILLDDYDCGKSLGHYLKIWLDKWACTGEIKGGTLHLQHHHFVITSNYSIDQMFEGDPAMCEAIRRRCEIIYMGEVFKQE